MVASREDSGAGSAVTYLSPPTEFQMASEWFDSVRADHFWFQWRFRAMRRLLPSIRPGDRILEVGCGSSVARREFERAYDCCVEGCDVNPEALRQTVPCRGRPYFYNILDRRSEWREQFSLILLLDTLEHIREPVSFLQAIAYHLQPGGLLLVNVPALQSLYSRYDVAAGHVKRYRSPLLHGEFEAAGLSLVRHAYWGCPLLPVAVARKLLMAVTPESSIIRTGFEPPSRMADRFLRLLMGIECCLFPNPPVGTSLLALAQKEA